jgi:acyl-CoA dehydrogenase
MKYLPDMNAGKKILAIAMTEPVAGSDLQGVRTTATKSDDGKVSSEAVCFLTPRHPHRNGVLKASI